MSFEAELLSMTGDTDDAYDLRVGVRRCFFYDFEDAPVRLWDGQGRLFAGGQEWLGTIDIAGTNYHRAPAIRDPRDGASPKYEFGIPYMDAETYAALKADQALVKGRMLTCYHVAFMAGEGLRPGTALRFAYRLEMFGAKFTRSVEGSPASPSRVYSATVLCRSQEYGRSRVFAGTYTDTAQQERARLLGLASDSGCSFVAGNATRTYIVGG